ncbi:MAG: cytochrome c, partial [Bacteroidota bacterium]
MKRKILSGLSGFLIVISLYSCKSGKSSDKNAIIADSATIAKGEIAFTQNCSSCHNFKRDGIGPQLSGITEEASAEWLQHFIKDPKQTIESGDDRAKKLFEKYHVVMPSFGAYPDDQISAIISFLSTQHKGEQKEEAPDPNALKNPIPDSITLSNLVVDIKPVTQFPASSDSGKLPLTRITKLDYQPKNGGSFILDLRGKLYKLQNDQPVVYMDMAKLEPKFINVPGLATGFGSFAFHPDFFKNGLLYTTHSEPAHSGKDGFDFPDSIKSTLRWVLTEWKTDQPGAVPFTGK